jgi:hypothetical protein
VAGAVILPAAVKGALAALAVLAVIGLVAAVASSILRTAERAESESRGDIFSRRRALDELVGLGSLEPDEYADRRAALLREP